ncbi:hypothetical protein [Aquimarina sediminis]|uniref:hypothetical protein n=1 Tax=Aquimarina sediminis TaxID=2070536 RepID=UPI000FFF4D16|nr:hypothetical protein [Aquimarina sediminis]
MRILICLLLTLTINLSFSQKKLNYVDIRTELENSSRSLHLLVFLPNSDFYIGTTMESPVENPELNPCIDIKSNNYKNATIIGILTKHGLLDRLFIEINNKFVDLDSEQVFKPKETELYLELFFKTRDFGFINCFIPILDKTKAKKFVNDLSEILDSEYCFEKLKRKI